MAITTYAELQTAIAKWLARSGDTEITDNAADFIALAESEINRRLRVRQQEATTDLTINAQSIALPTGFIGVRRIYLSASPLINPEYMAPDVFWREFVDASTGRPRNFTIEGDSIVFGPTPDATYTGKMLYWKRQDITASAHTLFTQNPDLYLFGALKETAPFIKDDGRVSLWEGKFENALASAQSSDDRDRYGGSSLAMRSSGYTP